MASSGGDTSNNPTTSKDSRSLLAIVLDVSTCAWGERDLRRAANDKARHAQNKRSVGPATLEEVLKAVQAFATAFGSLERGSGLLIIAVAGNESAVVFPRKDHLARYFSSPETNACYDLRRIHVDLTEGVAELMGRSSSKLSAAVAAAANSSKPQEAVPHTLSSSSANTAAHSSSTSAAMAASFSLALCCINRFLVATRTGVGVSAVQSEHFLGGSGNDGGVLAMIGGGDSSNKKKPKKANAWSPRILLVQASEDRSRDYNAFMNCAFAAVKHNVVVDGCFIPSGGGPSAPTSSAFVEQACDLSSGVFLAPSGAAQVGGALTEVLMSVFLAPRSCRASMNLPSINKVDFRARCFETGEVVDSAFVCNQCLSIFKKNPKDFCPTCQAAIMVNSAKKKLRTDTSL